MVYSAALISLFYAAFACANEHASAPAHVAPAAHAGDLPERPAVVSPRDVKVPRTLIERLESEYAREFKLPLGANGRPTGIKRGLLALAIELRQSGAEGALNASERLVMQLGGGTLDLAGLVGPRRAAFNVRPVPRDAAGAEVAPSRVFFVSHARPRELDGATFGDGCGTVIDLTSAFGRRFARRGFDVYSAERRYVSTLAGTFLFARFDQSALQVASVTFTDSRYPQLTCESR